MITLLGTDENQQKGFHPEHFVYTETMTKVSEIQNNLYC